MQDQRRQAAPGAVGRDPRMPVPDPTCPWLTRNIVVANNTIDSSGQYQVWALDVSTHIPASSMNLTVDGNVFASKATAASASMVGWGAADNHSLTTYQSPAALQTALNHGWTNLQAASVLTVALQSAWIAVPLPSALAADIAVAAGTQHVGIF
jgi:hypothetical protein